MITKNYTLEKHLKSLADNDKDYEPLYSIWSLNKKNLTQGLNMISSSFPNYSVHDISHSITIVDNIQCFLGEDRIKRLGATDTFLILMAGLTHDIGMILTYKMLEKEWEKDGFLKTLDYYSKSNDHIISDAAKIILKYGEEKKDENGYKWALEIKNAVVLISAEIFRNKHAEQSSEDLTINTEFRELADNFYSKQLPRRFVDLLAKVALLHGESFEDVMSHLYQKANGLKGDYIHPRFIACMIRLGDLLDFDSNRFNAFSNATIKEMPETSVSHQQKHASVKHMLVSPTSIEAELDCHDEKVYRVARSWFDGLEKEVNMQSREWTNIAPEDLGGLPPVISKNKIKILYNGIIAKSELLNLRFTMSQQKIFNILQGGGIYKEPGFAFVREIVQNAFDASKIQMWNDIKAGLYDSFFEEQKTDVNNIYFPDDIPTSIYKQYPVTLSVRWKDDEKKVLHFECVDHGTGISEKALVRMTQHVGESYRNDDGYDELYNSMPGFLRPTAAFGIGLQSVFFVSQTFEVETSYPGETTKKIIFRSAADNLYSSIEGENIEHKRGTTIKVDVPKDRFEEVFGNSFSWDILDSVDVFRDEGDNLHLAKIDYFVRNTFERITNYVFKYKSENPERDLDSQSENKEKGNVISEKYKLSIGQKKGFLSFKIMENRFGSLFEIWFDNQFEYNRMKKSVLLRDVLVTNAHFNYLRTSYMGFTWNLYNQTTDKIVDLSRDNLTYKGRQWVTNTLLNDLLPDFLNLIAKTFHDELKKKKTDLSDIDIQYFNYCITALTYNNIKPYNLSFLKKIELPKNIISYNTKKIQADKLFGDKPVYLISGIKKNGQNVIPEEIQNHLEEKYKKEFLNKILIWGEDYLHSVLVFNYVCTEIILYKDDCKFYKLEKKNYDDKKPILVECNEIKYLQALERNPFHECTRASIYGIKRYSHIIVKTNYVSGFEHFPDYSRCCIYSPFSKKEQIKELMDITKELDNTKTSDIIRNKLTEYITPSLMQVIKCNNINENISEEDIKNDYVAMISDFIKLKRDIQGSNTVK